VKIFFVRVTRVPRPGHADARFGERVSTRSFARGQTPRRGLPGNCWKHLASVCSVIKARSRLVHRCGSYESSPPYLPPRKRDAQRVQQPLGNFGCESLAVGASRENRLTYRGMDNPDAGHS